VLRIPLVYVTLYKTILRDQSYCGFVNSRGAEVGYLISNKGPDVGLSTNELHYVGLEFIAAARN